MNWRKAITQSIKGTATRVEEKEGKKYSTIRYNDGSGYQLVSEGNTVIWNMTGELPSSKLEGYDDWQPSV